MVRLLSFIRKSWFIKNNTTVARYYSHGGENPIMNARIGIDGRAAAAMVMLCAIWGMQQVAIKAAEPDVSAVLQIAIRSGLAALAVYLLARGRGERFTDRATLCAGLSVGALFALEFFLSPQGCVTPAPRIWRCFCTLRRCFPPLACIFSFLKSACRRCSGWACSSPLAAWCWPYRAWPWKTAGQNG